MSRCLAILWAVLLAWFVGKALNVPVWRDWDIGDRSDMAIAAGMLVFFLTSAARRKEK